MDVILTLLTGGSYIILHIIAEQFINTQSQTKP